ncbi:MAG: primosomal protein N' [Chloroflexi bacterium]|nr:primosomal protein N' [Chloroflexota bacterium]
MGAASQIAIMKDASPAKTPPRFAQVVVLLPIDRRLSETRKKGKGETLVDFSPESQVFTYGILREQAGRVKPGQVWWVPFGKSKQQGVVLRLSHEAPRDFAVKPLSEPVMDEPALTAAQLELALWLSRRYLAPLSECMRLILPPGFGARSQVMVEWTPGAPIYPDALTPAQQALLLHLRRKPMSLAELRRMDRRLASDDVLGALLKEGLLRLTDRTSGRAPKPKTQRRVRLAISPDQIDRALMHLGRGSKQAEALAWLGDHPEQEPKLSELAEIIGSSVGPIQKLAAKGWVEITDEGRVRLRLSPEQVPATVIAMRGAERYRRPLETLARAGDEPVWVGWLYAEAETNAATVRKLALAGLLELSEEEVWRDPLAGREFQAERPIQLTQDQKKAWEQISAGLDAWLPLRPAAAASPPVYLIHGVTGSGKTELYLRALQRTVDAGRQGIVLVPEISLTPQTVRRFAARFPGRVAVMHSKLSDGERFDAWRRAKRGEIDVMVGSRSALFAPFSNIGLIVVDEEHDAAYKQVRTPRYHARDAAIELARLSAAVTLLGSATPSLETYFQARRGVYTLLELPRRVRGHWSGKEKGERKTMGSKVEMLDMPPVEVVDMRAELRAGNRSMFSRALSQALRETLARGEQAILFLNRRGSASFVLCRDCGHVMHCPRCAVPLTHHRHARVLICHHCNHRQPMPTTCPKCNSRHFKEFGAGTQRLIDALKAEFPSARPLRWDRDATGGKTSHEDILQDFIDHKADVLVGTQMIAKGLDLPLVTLVGVLSADVGLFLPDFRAAERVFQVLTQVAGRAGRSARGGKVIFQTYHPSHYAINAAAHHDYAAFYRQEMPFRQEHGYPPYRRLTRLLYLDANRERCQHETERMARRLLERAEALGLDDFRLIGPAPAFFSKERGKFRWHIIFRSEDPAALLATARLTPNWRIDVDPVDTL